MPETTTQIVTSFGVVIPTPAGTWSPYVTYPAKKIVFHEPTGSSYVSKVANRGVEPGTDNEVWQIVAQGGRSITYERLTEEQKDNLRQPLTEQVTRVEQQLAEVLAAIQSLDPASDNNVAALAARLANTDNRTATIKGVVSDLDSLDSSDDYGLYFYAGTSAAKGLVVVSYDNSGNVTQHFLSSSTPVYTAGAVTNWVPGPALLTRTYRNNAWSVWQNRIEQNVWLTQAEYDALVASDAIDPNIEYNIYEE